LDGWLSSNSSASNRWQFRTPHDRRNVPRPRLSRFRSEPQQISVSSRSVRRSKHIPYPSAPPFSLIETRHSPFIVPFHMLRCPRSTAKNHSIPSVWFRLRSMNSIRSAPARPFRRSTPFLRRSTSDRIRFIIGCCLQRRLWSDLRLADYTSLGLINVAPLITLDVHAWRIACASKSTLTHNSPP
jgi:hypothetical protein